MVFAIRPLDRPSVRDTILYGGLTAGLLDACDASLFFGSRGASPPRIAQYISSALLGKAAFDGGAATVALGIALHFAVALSIATAFYLASRWIPALVRRPVIGGLAFGVVAFAGMNWGVVPLTRATHSLALPPLAVLINGVVGHAVLIGLPIALWAARSILASARAAAPDQGVSGTLGATRGTTPPRRPISIDP